MLRLHFVRAGACMGLEIRRIGCSLLAGSLVLLLALALVLGPAEAASKKKERRQLHPPIRR